MITIPLQAVPSQVLSVTLNNQDVQINISSKPQGVFVDVNCNGIEVTTSTIALDSVQLVRQAYLGMSGNLIFVDTQGSTDPIYTGFGTRYELLYLTEAEYVQLYQ